MVGNDMGLHDPGCQQEHTEAWDPKKAHLPRPPFADALHPAMS